MSDADPFTCSEVLKPVRFKTTTAEFDVALTEDGALSVASIGPGARRILIMPSSNVSCLIRSEGRENGLTCIGCGKKFGEHHYVYEAYNQTTKMKFAPLCALCVRGDTSMKYMGPPWKHLGPFTQRGWKQ